MSRIILIDGKPQVPPPGATVAETGTGVYSVLSEGASHEVRVSGAQITVDGHSFEFEVADPRSWKRSGGAADAHGRASIKAPMPGKVVRILAAVGDKVTAGQGIVVVEAMKMQNEMKAPRDGTVSAIAVKENDSVVAGTILAEID